MKAEPIQKERDADSVDVYTRSVRQIPLLTREGEKRVAARIDESEHEILVLALRSPAGVEYLTALYDQVVQGAIKIQDVVKCHRQDEAVACSATVALQDVVARLRAVHTIDSVDLRLSMRQLRGLADAVSSPEVRAAERAAEEARRVLFEGNLRLVLWHARKYVRRGVAYEDLVQEGNFGLMRAVEKFDWRQGTKFSTYASNWIMQTILRAIEDHSRVVRVPNWIFVEGRVLRRTVTRLTRELCRDPTVAECAEVMGVRTTRIERLIRALKISTVPLDCSPNDTDEPTLAERLADPRHVPADDRVNGLALRERVRCVLATLSPREEAIMRLRFGLVDDNNLTLVKIGTQFGLTRERIRQIEYATLAKLRGKKYRHRLEGFV